MKMDKEKKLSKNQVLLILFMILYIIAGLILKIHCVFIVGYIIFTLILFIKNPK